MLPPLGSAFKAAETTYGVNAEYLVAHAMEESGFGTSYIAQAFHNLFGWNAIDSDPVGNAMHFARYEESIDFVAERVATLYLSPTGAFYGGAPTLAGMSSYATGALWAANIARIANQMEAQLPSLAGLGVVLAPPTIATLVHTAESTTLTVGARAGAPGLPDGLRAAYRFVPLALVPGAAASTVDRSATPPWVTMPGSSSGGSIAESVVTPTAPGTYRLEVELLDSDGTPLTEPGFTSLAATSGRGHRSRCRQLRPHAGRQRPRRVGHQRRPRLDPGHE